MLPGEVWVMTVDSRDSPHSCKMREYLKTLLRGSVVSSPSVNTRLRIRWFLWFRKLHKLKISNYIEMNVQCTDLSYKSKRNKSHLNSSKQALDVLHSELLGASSWWPDQKYPKTIDPENSRVDRRCEVFVQQTLPTPARRLGIAGLGGLAKHFRLHLEDEGVPHEGAPQRSLNWLLRDRVVTDLGTWLGESLYLVILRDHPRSKGGKYWRHV